MAGLNFSKRFIEKCQEYIDQNPSLAVDVREFIRRCGRLGLLELSKLLGDCDDEKGKSYYTYSSRRRRSNADANSHNTSSNSTTSVYIPDDEVGKVREFIRKHGLFKTVISFYYFCAWMVMLGYWKLPPKPPV